MFRLGAFFERDTARTVYFIRMCFTKASILQFVALVVELEAAGGCFESRRMMPLFVGSISSLGDS